MAFLIPRFRTDAVCIMLVIRCSIDVSLATVQFQVTGPNKTMESMADKKIAHENDKLNHLQPSLLETLLPKSHSSGKV